MMNQKILGQFTSDDYKRSSIIEPPDSDIFQKVNMRKTRVPIDSRTRNISLYPSQNSYAIELEDNIEDIDSCKLIYCDIPMPMYLINNNFNKIQINISNTIYNITLINGNYDTNTLATEMQTRLSNITGQSFTVTYIPLTDNYTFACTTAFSIIFLGYQNPLNLLLGFDLKNYGPSTTIQSTYRCNFYYNNYVIMDIDQFDVLKSCDKDLNKSFALIPIKYNALNICDYMEYTKKFSPPLGRLMKIHFRFYDKFGNPYDFQNQDHHFELLFESHKQKRKYNH
jgi:hypothetical protein